MKVPLKGLLLVANIFDPSESFLNNSEYVKESLEGIIMAAGLTPVTDSYTCRFFYSPIEKAGYSAQMILLESHIYIHTWPEYEFARLEISSCRIFEVLDTAKAIKWFAKAKSVEYKTIKW